MGLFDKIKKGMQKTSDAVSRSLDAVFAGFVTIDDDLLEELEEALILSAVGAANAAKIVMEVERRAQRQNVTSALELRYAVSYTHLDVYKRQIPYWASLQRTTCSRIIRICRRVN